jgi:hypothetical protein
VSPAELERYLHEHIPLSRAMGVAVDSATTDGVRLRAPLAPNINHRETVFGGSASALCILAAWQRLDAMLARKGRARIEIQATLEYCGRAAGRFTGEFVAIAR